MLKESYANLKQSEAESPKKEEKIGKAEGGDAKKQEEDESKRLQEKKSFFNKIKTADVEDV